MLVNISLFCICNSLVMGNRDGDKAVYAKINTGRLGWNRALAWTQVEVKATDGVQPGQSETLINCTVYQAFNAVEGPPRFVFSLFMFAFCPMDLGFLICHHLLRWNNAQCGALDISSQPPRSGS